MRIPLLSSVVLGFVILSACSSKKDNPPQPEETAASMKNIQDQSMGECPDVGGYYVCSESDDQTPFNLVLRKNNVNEYHFTYIDATSSTTDSFIDRSIENLLFDDGGFIVNGKVQDKAAFARELSEGILDPKLIESMKVAYVASCTSNELKVHFIVGPTAVKSRITKNPDSTITQTLFHLNEEGQIKKESGICVKKIKTKDGTYVDANTSGNAEVVVPTPPTDTAEISSYPSEVIVKFIEKDANSFSEPINIRFTRYGTVFSRHLYTFTKSFLGPVDNRAFFWWQQGDDVEWNTPWSVISIDMTTKRVYGGTAAGDGVPFGDLIYDGKSFQLKMLIEYSIDKENQKITILDTPQPNVESTTSCPYTVKVANLCTIYVGVYDTLSAFDYAAIGEAGPAIARDVVSFTTAFRLTKSAWFFKGEIDQIRTDYLIPVLHVIGQLKALKRADQNNREAYIQQTTNTYSNMVVTSVDTILKTQKLMPEAVQSVGKTSFGFLLSYIGMNSVGDRLTKQPRWVGELITPIILKFSSLSMDLVFNNSNTPFMERVERLISIEEEVKSAVKRLCESSPTTAQNECMAALNQ